MRGRNSLANISIFLLFAFFCGVRSLSQVSVRENVRGRILDFGDLTSTYVITSQVPAQPRFNIAVYDTSMFLLAPQEGLDAETCSSYNLTIAKTNQENVTLMVNITVRVADVNEFPPVFYTSTYSASISVAASVEPFVLQVEAHDNDVTAKVALAITGGNTLDTFAIRTINTNGATPGALGEIYVQPNKHCTEPMYNLTIGAYDESKSAFATVLIYCIDACAISPCQNGATCNPTLTSYVCQCVQGWMGTNCQTDIDECASTPCQNSATCYNLQNSFSCQCEPGWTGTNCETDIDECANNPCQNGATCYNQQNSFSCQCVHGWTGINCETVLGSDNTCPAHRDKHGFLWDDAPAPSRRTRPDYCPPQYTGEVYRRCDENAEWQETVYNCTADTLTQIKQEIKNSSLDVTNVLKRLVKFTTVNNDSATTLLVGDVQGATDILENIVDIVDSERQDVKETIEDFLQIADNLMDVNTTQSWKSIIAETNWGVDKVLTNIDRFVEKIATASNESVDTTEFVKTNFYVQIAQTKDGVDGEISFPNRSSANLPHWAKGSVNGITLPIDKGMTNVSYSGIIYKDLRNMIPEWSNHSNKQASEELDSPVISLTLYTELQRNLENPTTVTFQLFERKFHKPRCSFWNERLAFWDTEGCVLDGYDTGSGVVVCKCSHLTNFAVLMSHAPASGDHHATLGIISMTGCITSMLCLVLTFVLYVYHWKMVSSDLAKLLLNLCVVLFLAYLAFLLGVDKVADKDVCTAVAVVLHLLYLTAFFLMLAKGLYLAKLCLRPTNRAPIIKRCLFVAYGGPVLVVAVSMGATKLQGYGTDKTCWLSIDSGLLWAFVGPVLYIILMNMVVVVIALKVKCSTQTMKRKTQGDKISEGLRTILVLLPAMGVTWILGVFSVNEETLAFQYLFAICNSLQGLLIFIVHCVLDKKMRKQVDKTFRKSVRHVRLQGPSASNTTTASGNTSTTLDTKTIVSPTTSCAEEESFATLKQQQQQGTSTSHNDDNSSDTPMSLQTFAPTPGNTV